MCKMFDDIWLALAYVIDDYFPNLDLDTEVINIRHCHCHNF